MFNVLDITYRLLTALLLGGLVGWERERHERPAGFRTHILVTVGSALLMVISLSMVELYPDTDADPARIAAQVVSGIGFLGAGTIIREGFSVKGLTTAASLWTVAAIGLAAGAGYYKISTITTLIVFITLFFLSKLELGVSSVNTRILKCRVMDKPGLLGEIGVTLGSKEINITNVNIEKNSNEGEMDVELIVKIPRNFDKSIINQELLKIEGIRAINWRNL
ncbi:MgtC/SapB family protein [Halothermothrix orenii]|uniref:MgtC/SapB transporter n=1 Tax=Halothermothrix orenii (strain H 168 / OCM 544 / DSM 9562) TaxID=373903 RepID=B8CW67_HALOH|nr:MgtC/SapB family protein [Halothermothrix orenii]ACL69536.1 MgtC/SapB transporter [Halothermothrix orenii H 168]